jgi:hypothetical protein
VARSASGNASVLKAMRGLMMAASRQFVQTAAIAICHSMICHVGDCGQASLPTSEPLAAYRPDRTIRTRCGAFQRPAMTVVRWLTAGTSYTLTLAPALSSGSR